MTPRGRPPGLVVFQVMRIQCTNPGTKRLKLDWMDSPIEFASTGTAQVEQELGERLVDEVDAIEPYEDNE